ncbi:MULTISPECIES: GAF domain-containing protein [unclassified Achromobacter]|uniref:GAF domain-containing protein n=1 Tax=unclassified Achromobacter TaxID=2626865 RepID=UPI000B51E063|nr:MULTISPECIES: GAF domain-containing protein [unclassified Achromobacter]OWT71441.1 GAF domain-containing protein [Achromobacter sp. HZ34]OWT73098.1 GAF domain-containing protein [Achromobacter sp. HZ28]
MTKTGFLTTQDLQAISAAIVRPPRAGAPDALLQALDHIAQREMGHRLFTALRYDLAEGLAHRLYSSAPAVYAASGSKQIGDAPALREMVATGKPRLAPDAAAVRRDFLDAEAIFSLGCASVLNIPVHAYGRLLGQINLLHDADHYRPADIEHGTYLAALAAPAFMIHG